MINSDNVFIFLFYWNLIVEVGRICKSVNLPPNLGMNMIITSVVSGRVPAEVDVVLPDADNARRTRGARGPAPRLHLEPLRRARVLAEPGRVLSADTELVLVSRFQVISLKEVDNLFVDYFI